MFVDGEEDFFADHLLAKKSFPLAFSYPELLDRGMSVCGVSHVTPHTPSHDSIRGRRSVTGRGLSADLREETPFPVTPHLPSRIERVLMEEGCNGEETSRLSDNNVQMSLDPLHLSSLLTSRGVGNEDADASLWLVNNEASTALLIPHTFQR